MVAAVGKSTELAVRKCCTVRAGQPFSRVGLRKLSDVFCEHTTFIHVFHWELPACADHRVVENVAFFVTVATTQLFKSVVLRVQETIV